MKKANRLALVLAGGLALSLGAAARDGSGGGHHEEHHHAEHDHSDHHHGEHHHDAAVPHGVVGLPQEVALRLPDAPLLDQDGHPQRLVSEVIGDRVVVAGFVYTTCTTVCPVVSALFSRLQDRLGEDLDSRVRLLSLSVDPLRDTPARLKDYAARHGARPGWLWLTGRGEDVAAALKGFGTYTADYRDHPVTILVGDGRSGRWTRFYGFEDPDRLAARVREYLASRDRPGLAGRE